MQGQSTQRRRKKETEKLGSEMSGTRTTRCDGEDSRTAGNEGTAAGYSADRRSVRQQGGDAGGRTAARGGGGGGAGSAASGRAAAEVGGPGRLLHPVRLLQRLARSRALGRARSAGASALLRPPPSAHAPC